MIYNGEIKKVKAIAQIAERKVFLNEKEDDLEVAQGVWRENARYLDDDTQAVIGEISSKFFQANLDLFTVSK